MRKTLTGPEVDSFYHLSGIEMQHRFCRGLSCFAGKELDPYRWRQALEQWPPVYCLGKCYMSPSSTQEEDDPVIETHCRTPIILADLADCSSKSFDDYRRIRGYETLLTALSQPGDAIITEVELSHLRGRGGAGFPAYRKWRAVANALSEVKYVVANADEGDHGSYIDRFIMEREPHRLLEALILSGYAVGANKGYIYLRKEYPRAKTSLDAAIAEARAAGLLGETVNGSEFAFDVEIVIGQGSYVCGEETSLLNSIEHRRPEVRARPPYPTEQGLFGQPTLVNNVETLSSVPWIVRNGGQAYAAMGHSTSRGTKAVSLNSLFNRPGLYEVEFGTTLREIFEGIGGGLKTGPFRAAIIGGPLAGLIHPDEFDTPLGFDELQAIGASVGHGGVVAFDQSLNFAELMAHVFTFGALESCGKCLPCRLGTRRAETLFSKMADSEKVCEPEKSELFAVLESLHKSSLCGHGTGLAEFALSAFRKFGKELEPCFA